MMVMDHEDADGRRCSFYYLAPSGMHKIEKTREAASNQVDRRLPKFVPATADTGPSCCLKSLTHCQHFCNVICIVHLMMGENECEQYLSNLHK